MLEITVKKNPFIETLVSKEELFADFAEFATRKNWGRMQCSLIMDYAMEKRL